ncbi:NAD-dependent epimerase/dehydratase family protein [Pseudomonas sp. Z2-11]
MKKILVTGANGFVGQHLCAFLSDAGTEVTAVVRTEHSFLPNVRVVVASLDAVPRALLEFKEIDCVIHLAGRAHQLNDTSSSPLEDFRAINRDLTVKFARDCLEAGIKRFVFISSIGVNGAESFNTPFTENDVCNPHADYAISKLEAENELAKIFEGSDSELVIIRPPLVYGANAPGNFNRLLKLVSLGIPLPFGSVRNFRSMVSLANLSSFIALAAVHPRAANEVFLIADGEALSLPDIINLLSEGMNKRSWLLPVPLVFLNLIGSLTGKSATIAQLCGSLVVDSSKGRELLGWEPLESPQQGLIQAGQSYVNGSKLGKK